MPQSSHHRRSSSRPTATAAPGWQALAALLAVILALGTVAPAWAVAGELDSEGEGSAPPGGAPGLEESPGFEPGGGETVLEELPPLPGEEGAEVTVPSEEPEPPPPSLPAPPSDAPPPPETAPEGIAPPVEEAPPSQAPVYEAEPGANHEAAPAPAPVENQPIIAPPAPAERQRPQSHEHVTEAPPPAAPAPATPPDAPKPPSAPPATTVVRERGAGSLEGRGLHAVAPGECLWSIAAALLPGGAGNDQIAAEVQRLWQLNATRIGTGDPNLILVGTELRLR